MTHPLEHYFSPVGRVVVLFGQIETVLLIIVAGMCHSEYGAVSSLMAEASFARKLDAFKCVADEKLHDPPWKLRIADLLKTLQGAEDTRNRIAHTLWTQGPNGKLMSLKWTAKRKHGNKPGLRFITMQEITSAGDQVQAALLKLHDFGREVQGAGILKGNIY